MLTLRAATVLALAVVVTSIAATRPAALAGLPVGWLGGYAVDE